MTTAEFFAGRHAELEAGALALLRRSTALTATAMASDLRAGSKELTRVLESMRVRGLVTRFNRRWSLA
ncbi:MAG: hypothetical protein WC700_02275 [Gemmatimonadaceae bacterium]|jgi:hypothetical protein